MIISIINMSYFYNFQAGMWNLSQMEPMIYIAVISFYYLTCKMYILIALYFVYSLSQSPNVLRTRFLVYYRSFTLVHSRSQSSGKAVIQLESIFKYHHAYNPRWHIRFQHVTQSRLSPIQQGGVAFGNKIYLR